MNNITWSDVLNLAIPILNISKEDSICKRYIAWRKLDPMDESKLSFIGNLAPDSSQNKIYEEEFHTFKNYWAEDYPIALAYYPYNGCGVYKFANIVNGGYYFVYVEFGGHAPEKRCRLIQPDLVFTSIT
jgi:hypothetical protein